jgi:hypothetical protein
MALELPQPLTGIFVGVKWGRPAREADNLTATSEPIIWKMWDPRRLTILWNFTFRYRDSSTFFYFYENNTVYLIELEFLSFLYVTNCGIWLKLYEEWDQYTQRRQALSPCVTQLSHATLASCGPKVCFLLNVAWN